MDISVKKLSEILKIDPNALLEKMIAAGLPQKDIEDSVREKISLYCDVQPDSVISLRDFESVYDIPIHLEKQGLGNTIIEKLGYENLKPDLKKFNKIVNQIAQLFVWYSKKFNYKSQFKLRLIPRNSINYSKRYSN